MKPAAFGLAAGLALALSSACLANDLKGSERFSDTNVAFDLQGPVSNATLTISGPDRFHAVASTKSGAPYIDLRQFGAIPDGLYRYQLVASTGETERIMVKLDSGRPPNAAAPLKSAAASGTFRVKGGVIVKRDTTARQNRQDPK